MIWLILNALVDWRVYVCVDVTRLVWWFGDCLGYGLFWIIVYLLDWWLLLCFVLFARVFGVLGTRLFAFGFWLLLLGRFECLFRWFGIADFKLLYCLANGGVWCLCVAVCLFILFVMLGCVVLLFTCWLAVLASVFVLFNCMLITICYID